MAGLQAAGDAGGSPQHTQNVAVLDFEDAVRAETKARIALTGVSGSGKTFTALTIAAGMGDTVGVIDTERGSAANYAGLFRFKHLRMPNSRPQTLIQALEIAAERGIDVVIIDSMTHFWSGQGGILDQVDSTTSSSSSKNAFTTGWKGVKPIEHDMWDKILSYPGHVIATIRVKTGYEIQVTASGKKEPVKIGLKPDQREGADYEFDLVGDLNLAHVLTVNKSRYPGVIDVNATIECPTIELGQAIVGWLAEGVQLPTVPEYVEHIMKPTTSYDELMGLYKVELPQRGLLKASVVDPETKEKTTLGALVVRIGTLRNPKNQAQQMPPTSAQRPSQDVVDDLMAQSQRVWDSPDGMFQVKEAARRADAWGAAVEDLFGNPTTMLAYLDGRLAELKAQRDQRQEAA